MIMEVLETIIIYSGTLCFVLTTTGGAGFLWFSNWLTLCRAEAERMRMKASAYKQYGDAAILAMVLEALPQIAAEVSAPLAKTDEIVLIGKGGVLKGQ